MAPNLTAGYIIYAIIAILIGLVIHEFMHAYVGHKLGDTTASEEGRLTLNPLSHIDPFMTVALPILTLLFFGAPFLAAKPVPFNPDRVRFDEFGAAMIAAAGPLINLVLAFAGVLALKYLGAGTAFGEFLVVFVTINIALFVFNMLPIPPLDGSRVLYAFAPEPLQRFMQDIEPYGIFILIALIFVADLGGFIGNLNGAVFRALL